MNEERDYTAPPVTPPQSAEGQTSGGLTFRPSGEVTLGVELELQILDPETGNLVPGALRILDACADEKMDGVCGEFLLSMIEVKTGVCRSVAEVRDSLLPLLRRVRNIAGSLGYDLALGGTHPFGRASESAIFPDERYRRIHKRQGWLAYHEAVFGLHLHVGVPGGDEAVGLINVLVEYLPHLLALSANSPFWQGIDTGFASSRAVLFRPSPHAGIPQHFGSWQDFCHYYAVMQHGGMIRSLKDVYWDIRPQPGLGTIEFRVCDAPATLSRLLGLTALARYLVLDGLRLLREQPELRRGDPRRFWLAAENRWLAARYGLKAECVREPAGERSSLADDTARLLERLLPVAREAGEGAFLQALRPASPAESDADRQRRLCRQTGTWQAVIDDLKGRWAEELDGVGCPKSPACLPSPPPPPEAVPQVPCFLSSDSAGQGHLPGPSTLDRSGGCRSQVSSNGTGRVSPPEWRTRKGR